MQYNDGEERDNIWRANLKAPVRFDVIEYGSKVKVRVAGEWRRGRLVELVVWEQRGLRLRMVAGRRT